MTDSDKDVEKATEKKSLDLMETFDSNGSREYIATNELSQSFTQRILHSFGRDQKASATSPGAIGADGKVVNEGDPEAMSDNTGLSKRLKKRHMAMIAAGSCIGTGLFVASGKALAEGGPASVLLAFTLVGIMLWCTIQALGEMAVLFPVAGSFSAYSTRFLDPAWGFAMGLNYALQWLVVLPLEIISASITINYWDQEHRYNHGIFVVVFLITITVINLIGVEGYGEAEFWCSLIKVVAVIGFIVFGVVVVAGGGPSEDYIGGRYWSSPGAFHNGFKGFCSVLVTAAFSFAGTELVGLTAAETANPAKSLPSAIKQVFWRITVFYITALCIIGLLVPYTEPHLKLTGNASSAASPFVIAINRAGIAALPSVFNAVILIAILSVGNSSVYGSSRTLAALADQGQLPDILGYVDRAGRPLVGIGLASSMGFLAFIIVETGNSGTALEWMLALSGLSTIFTWGSICLAHIRFRKAWLSRGNTTGDLVFKAKFGIAGSWLGFIMCILILAAQFWTSAWPEDYANKNQVKEFFLGFLVAPIILVFYIFWKVWKKTSIVRVEDMDIYSGRKHLNAQKLKQQAREDYKSLSALEKVGSWLY